MNRPEAEKAYRELAYYQEMRNALAMLDCVSALDAWYAAAPFRSEEQLIVLDWLVVFRCEALLMMIAGSNDFFAD